MSITNAFETRIERGETLLERINETRTEIQRVENKGIGDTGEDSEITAESISSVHETLLEDLESLEEQVEQYLSQLRELRSGFRDDVRADPSHIPLSNDPDGSTLDDLLTQIDKHFEAVQTTIDKIQPGAEALHAVATGNLDYPGVLSDVEKEPAGPSISDRAAALREQAEADPNNVTSDELEEIVAELHKKL